MTAALPACALLLAGSLVSAALIWKRLSGEPPLVRFAASAVPVLAALLVLQTFGQIVQHATLVWNDARLARAMVWFSGRLYPARDATGAIIGTMHAPLSHIYYSPLIVFAHPVPALVGGVFLSLIAVLVPVWIALRRIGSAAGTARWFVTLCFLTAASLILETSSTLHAIPLIHTDALACGLAALAAAMLCGRTPVSGASLWISAAAVCLSVWTKQTMLPAVAALPLYLWAAEGSRQFRRFAYRIVVAGAAISTALGFVFWSGGGFWFNTVVLGLHRPMKPDLAGNLVRAAATLRQDCTLPLAFAAFFLFWGASFSDRRTTLRALLAKERWAAFLWLGLALLPLGLKAWCTGDSDENHLALFSFYAILACAGALAAYGPRPAGEIGARAGAALCAALVLTVAYLAPGAIAYLPRAGELLDRSPSNVAWRYTRAHPGRAYFPRNPLAVYLAEGKLYDFDPALHDREVAGFPVTGDQLRSGLPPRFDLVAMPPGEPVFSNELARELRSWAIASDAELPDWTVYRRPLESR